VSKFRDNFFLPWRGQKMLICPFPGHQPLFAELDVPYLFCSSSVHA